MAHFIRRAPNSWEDPVFGNGFRRRPAGPAQCAVTGRSHGELGRFEECDMSEAYIKRMDGRGC